MKALVTGGTRGIGKALVLELLNSGWEVCTCARNIPDDMPKDERLLVVECDISKRDQVKRFVNLCVEKVGYLDLLVNNASILGERKAIEDYPENVWEEVLQINVNGTFYVTKYTIPYLKYGAIVINISSGAGKRPAPYWGAYAVSKFAIEGFSLLLNEELKDRNIRVYAFNPGATRTQMRAKAYPEEDPMALKPPEDVAKAILRLIQKRPEKVSIDYSEV
ncbi:SDR family NAD(P)-dependent oxidoreductase [Thermocrinis minervae]|uniref:NAD(P)-dependent dehydrogenase, short-chain alcohol dehydrogenase family n=1 Tax=Thermocrinis minervae TaxID=381751 RepID=A0A1M6SFL2_9AQUI|nr:SDR family oxidoreductase [Thermocrinis minervae]SHK43486.1 NAD(P)-dependent dehydrogenase, short-chain alcohol dehydrogenase family [Thermocrinis minervae]